MSIERASERTLRRLISECVSIDIDYNFILKSNTYIHIDFFEIIKSIDFDFLMLMKYIEPGDYFIRVSCIDCGKEAYYKFTHIQLINILMRNGVIETYRCDNCKIQTLIIDNNKTKTYCEKYISTKLFVFNSDTWNELNDIEIDFNEVSKEIKKLPYREFLSTNYWKLISNRLKFKNNYKCEKCGSNVKIEVHHTTYQNHGDELHNLKDLLVLCHDCHSKEHNIPVVKKEKLSKTKKVLQYSKDGEYIKEWNSSSDIQKKIKINSTNISSCCLGKLKTAGGFQWKYKEVDKIKDIKMTREQLINKAIQTEQAKWDKRV